MAFDASTARPVSKPSGGFNPATAKPVDAGAAYAKRSSFGLAAAYPVQAPLRGDVLEGVPEQNVEVDADGRRAAVVNGQVLPLDSGFDPATAAPVMIARQGLAAAPVPITGRTLRRDVVRGAIGRPTQDNEQTLPEVERTAGEIADSLGRKAVSGFRYGLPAQAAGVVAALAALPEEMRRNIMGDADVEAITQRANEAAQRRLNTETPQAPIPFQPIRRAIDPGSVEGRAIAERAAIRADQQVYAPTDKRAGLMERIAGDALESLPSTAVSIGAGIAAGPAAGLAAGSVLAGGDQYAEMREKGYAPDRALAGGFASGAFEAIGEVSPLGYYLKSIRGIGKVVDGNAVARVLTGTALEGADEAITQSLQEAYNAGVLNEQTLLPDALKRIGMAAATGAVMGGGVSGTIEATRATVQAPGVLQRYWLNKGVNPKLADLFARKAEDKAFKEHRQPTADDLLAGMDDSSDSELGDASQPYAGMRSSGLSEKAARAAMKADLLDGELDGKATAGNGTVTAALPNGISATVSGIEADADLDAALNNLDSQQSGEAEAARTTQAENQDEKNARPNPLLAVPGVPAQRADTVGDAQAGPGTGGDADGREGRQADAGGDGRRDAAPATVGSAAAERVDALTLAADGFVPFPKQTGTLGIPRAEMPQVKAEHRGAMVNFLNARGVEHEQDEVDPATLKATQAEFSPAKVEKAKSFEGGNRSILVSSDGYIVDGHHQALAALDKGEKIKIIRLKAPVRELLPLVKEFPSSTQAAVVTPQSAAEQPTLQPEAAAATQTPAEQQPIQQQQAKPREPDPFAATKQPKQPKRPKPKTAADMADVSRLSLLAEIRRMGGIEQAEMADITGEGRRSKDGKGTATRAGGQVRVLFTKNGVTLDLIRERMAELGYFTGDGDVTGDLDRVRDIIRSALDGDGEPTLTLGEREEYDALRADERAAAEEAAGLFELSQLERERAEVQYQANELLSEDERADLATRFEDDTEYFNALQEAVNAKREQDESDGGGQADAEAGRSEAGSARESETSQGFELEQQTEADLAAKAAREADPVDEDAARKQSEADDAAKAANTAQQRGLLPASELVRAADQKRESAVRNAPDAGAGGGLFAASQQAAAKPVADSPAATSKLDNFGESLPPSRRSGKSSLSEELTDEDYASKSLSAIWPADEVDAIEDPYAAALSFAARAEIPAKPRVAYKVARWVEKVKLLRGIATKVIDGTLSKRELADKFKYKPELLQFANKVALLEAIDRSQWKRIGAVELYANATRFEDGKQVPSPLGRVEVDGKTENVRGATAVAELVLAAEKLLGVEVQAKKMQFEVRGRDPVWGINKKGDPEYRKLKTFKTSKEALDYARTPEGQQALEAEWEAVKDRDNVGKQDVRNAENKPRTGKDHRNGKNVTDQQFQDSFGFKGVEFGKWMAQGEGAKDRQGMLNQLYDALLDLAEIVGVPPKAMSLNGTLGLGLGSRGSGWASAHFESSNLVINLTKTRGAGTLAHEWFHALDNYFSRQRGGEAAFTGSQQAYREANYITYKPEALWVRKGRPGNAALTRAELLRRHARDTGNAIYDPQYWEKDAKHPEGVRPEVEQRFAALVEALDASPMKARAAAIDKGGDGYWSRIIERGARSFESYVISKMMEKGYQNDYLANVKKLAEFTRNHDRYPYLTMEEVKPIAEAFDALFSTIETSEDDAGNVAMFSLKAALGERALPLEQVQSIVDGIKAKWKNPLPVKVLRSINDPETPPLLRLDYIKSKFYGATDVPRGALLNGTVYVFADTQQSEQTVVQTVFHEAIGHAGLRGALGKDLFPALMMVVQQRHAEVEAKAVKYGWMQAGKPNTLSRNDAVRAAEEVLAELAETRPEHSLVQRAIQAIRRVLKRMGLQLDLTDADIISDLIIPARRWVEQGRTATAARGTATAVNAQPAYALTASTKSAYEQRINELFNGAARERKGVKVLDRADILDLLGHGDKPLHLVESAVNKKGVDGKPKHPGMTAEQWAKVPQWIESPVAAFRSQSEPDRIVLFAPELVGGRPVRLVLEPSADMAGLDVHVAVNAYEESGTNITPVQEWVKKGDLLYLDQQNSPELAARSGLQLPRDVRQLRSYPRTVLTDADLVKYREEKPAFSLAPAGPQQSIPGSQPSASLAPPTGQPPLPLGGGSNGNNASWNALADSRFDRLVYLFQDKHIDTKRVLAAIRKAVQRLGDQYDTYLKEAMYHGRVAKRQADFLAFELTPLLLDMARARVTLGELQDYLHNLHAEEANEYIASINPQMPDEGSGIKTVDAHAYLAALTPVQRSRLNALAAKVDAIINGTRDTYVNYGLQSANDIAQWKARYQHYVPLMREDMDGSPGTGSGFSVRGPATRQRTGSTRAVVDIMGNIALARENAIVRGEKNRVANALLGLAILNPNPTFWRVNVVKKKIVFDPKTGLVTQVVDRSQKSDDNVVVARRPGKNSEIVEATITFNERDPRAARMATALKNLDVDQLDGAMRLFATITRWFASVNTRYNPVFGIVNGIRDVGAATMNLTTTPLAGKQADVLKNWPAAFTAIYASEFKLRRGVRSTQQMAQVWEQMQLEGGRTGYRDMFLTGKERGEAIADALNKASENPGKKISLMLFRALGNFLSDFNESIENATRLAVYKTAIDAGLTPERSAQQAKEITVNFNRKGASAQKIGALYAFFNAAMQGNTRLVETMTGPAGQKILAGGLMLGAMQAVMLAFAGLNDEEPPEFVRERAFIIPIGNKKYVSVPYPLGFHVIPNISRHAMEALMSGNEEWTQGHINKDFERGLKSPGEHVLDLLVTIASAMNPIGTSTPAQTLTPTPFDPAVALLENKDWTGKPIARRDYSNGTQPGYLRTKDTATEPAKWLAHILNNALGGTDYTASKVLSPTPDQIDFLVGQATGGAGRELSKLEQSISAAFSGEELPPYKIPLAGRFYGKADSQSGEADAFYRNLDDMARHEAEIKGRRDHQKPTDDYLKAHPEAVLVKAADTARERVAAQRKLKRERVAEDAPREDIKEIEARITELMHNFNERAKELRAAADE